MFSLPLTVYAVIVLSLVQFVRVENLELLVIHLSSPSAVVLDSRECLEVSVQRGDRQTV